MTGWPRLPPARTCRTAPAHRRRARRHRKGAFGLPSLLWWWETLVPPPMSGLEDGQRFADRAGAACDDRVGEAADRDARLRVRVRLEHRSACIRRLAQGWIEGHAREERRIDLRGERLAPAAAEELLPGADEPRHVLDHADDPHPGLLRHHGGADRDLLRGRLRR